MKTKNTSYNKFVEFLTKRKIKDNGDKKMSHISIGDYNKGFLMGSYSIDDNDMITFYNLYNKTLIEGFNLHMLESPKEQGPIIIDIDFKYELFKNSESRIYTDYDINNIIKYYTENINKYIILNDEENENCIAYILEKNKPKLLNELENKFEYKDGIHIIFPNLCVSTNTQLLIRLNTIEQMRENNELKHLGLTNDIEDIFDINVIGRNCWLLYGSTKTDEEGNNYKLTKILNNDLNDSEIKEDVYELTSLLSIRKFNKEKLCKFKNNYNEDEIKKEYDRKLNLKSDNTLNKNFRITYNDIDVCRKLIKLLDIYRSNNYKEWLEVGFCLKNIDENLLMEWIDFSKQSKKFKNGECEKLWKTFKKSGLGIGSLHMWAKNDNLDKYSDIIMAQYDGLITKSLDATHYKVALVFYKIYQSNFICESIKHKEIYEFKNHKWVRNDSSHCIVKKLNEEFYNLYEKFAKIIYNKMLSLNDNDFEQKNERKSLEIKYKAAQNVCKNIHNANYKEKLLSELHKLYYNEYFFNNLDSNKNLICFNNGVFDLEKMELRNGRPDDYISLSTNINYIPYDINNIVKLEQFFEEIQPNPDTRRFLYTILASCLDGNQRNQIFPILTGNGANGKGRLAKLVEDALGDYASTIDVSFLTQKRTSPGNANPQLAKTKGRRIIILQEPDNCDKLNTGLMKSITGGDKLEARKLYGDPFIIDPQFKTFLVCNNLPKIETIDGGTWRRVRAIPFKCTFKDNPDLDDPYQKKANPDLDDDLKTMTEALLSKLIQVYKETKGKITFIPEEVLEETNQYKSDSDIYEQYILDNLLLTKNNCDYINEKELFKHFNDWKLIEKKNIKTNIDKKTFIKDMINKLGKTKNNNFYGVIIKDQYELMTETENKSIASANTNDAIEYNKKMKINSIIIKNNDMDI